MWNKNKGFTLLEVITALFVLTVGVLAAYSVTSQLISATHLAANRLTAAYLAKEGIEIVRNIRDTNWLEGAASWKDGLGAGDWEADYDENLSAWANRYLYIEASNFYGYTASLTQTNFKRKITITDQADYLEVKVEVYWTEKGQPQGPIIVQENLYNWNP